jgi:membrane-associated phospholipid phosphatase
MKYKKRFIQLILLLVVVFILSYLISTVLKSYFKIPRPCVGLADCPSGYSFPSRHVTIAFALVMAFYLETKNKRISLVLLCAAMLLLAYRIITLAHTPADVIVGLIIGVLIGWLVQRSYLLARFLYNQRIYG